MNKKNVTQFLVLIFCIMLVAWGSLFVLGQMDLTMVSHSWLMGLMLLGGLSPTIASYIVLKKNGEVTNLKHWLKNVYNIKTKLINYIVVILGVVLFFGTHMLVSGLEDSGPLLTYFAMLPTTLIGGGLEEAGWRYILQPELDKKYGFIIPSIVVSVIWFTWHIPLFFIPETGQYTMNIWMFAVDILGMTFFYGALHRISSGRVFLSIFFHTMTNTAWNVLVFPVSWTGTILAAMIMILASVVLLLLNKPKSKQRTL